ncbi:MAG TPA: A/G-specific adenine glycosylase, partial [Candidatus Paceibacterota bacterium]
DKAEVSDAELLPFIERTLDQKRPREWNWALMDYGAHLKTTIGNVSVRSKTYKKQSPFKESNRYLRGAILRLLVSGSHTQTEIQAKLVPIEPERIMEQMSALLEEGLIQKTKKKYSL